MSKHRRATFVHTTAHPTSFKPKHCAGTDCLHDHRNDDRPSLGTFAPAFPPKFAGLVVVKDQS